MVAQSLNLKLVFQGGGANLVSLMAAASVIEDLEKRGLVNVVSVAGVSAGAIVACMLSSRTTIDTYRLRILSASEEYLPKFKLKTKSSFQRLKIARDLIKGNPLFKESDLKQFFNEVFVKPDESFERFENFRIPTKIIASDLDYKEKLSYTKSKDPQKKIIQALVDSCALPYAFRTHHSTIVDGGVVNNFPIDEFLNDGIDGELLGFSFKPRPQFGNDNAFAYGVSLLTTSIDSTVKENAERLKSIGGEICLLPKNFGLIEFEKALKDGLKTGPFRSLIAEIEGDLIEAVERLNEGAINKESIQDIQKKVLNVYSFLGNQNPCERHIIGRTYGESFFEGVEKDRSVTTLKVKPIKDPIQMFSHSLGVNTQPIIRGEEEWSVENDKKTSLNAERILAPEIHKSPEGAVLMHKAMYFLEEPFKKEDGWVSALQVSRGSFLAPLFKGELDWSRHQSLPPHNLSLVVQILYIPKGFGAVTLGDLKANMELISQHCSETLSEAENMRRKWTTGRAMTNEELAQYVQDEEKLKYSVYGWVTRDVKHGFYCGYAVGGQKSGKAQLLIT